MSVATEGKSFYRVANRRDGCTMVPFSSSKGNSGIISHRFRGQERKFRMDKESAMKGRKHRLLATAIMFPIALLCCSVQASANSGDVRATMVLFASGYSNVT